MNNREKRLEAVTRVLDGAQAVVATLEDALSRLRPEIEQLRAEVAAAAISQVEARRAWGDDLARDVEMVREALKPGAIVRREHFEAATRVRQAGLFDLLKSEARPCGPGCLVCRRLGGAS